MDGKIIYERKIYRNLNVNIPIEDEEVQMLGEAIV